MHDRQYWQNDGMPLTLPLESIRAVVADYNLEQEMVEMISLLEREIMDERRKAHKSAGKKNGKRG